VHHSRSWQIYGTPARCTLQFVRRCYGLRGIYGRFYSKIRFEIESDGRFDSRFDSNAKKRFTGASYKCNISGYVIHTEDVVMWPERYWSFKTCWKCECARFSRLEPMLIFLYCRFILHIHFTVFCNFSNKSLISIRFLSQTIATAILTIYTNFIHKTAIYTLALTKPWRKHSKCFKIYNYVLLSYKCPLPMGELLHIIYNKINNNKNAITEYIRTANIIFKAAVPSKRY